MKHQPFRLLAVLLAFALVAFACGDDDDDGAEAAGTTTTESADGGAAPEVTEPPAEVAEPPEETMPEPAGPVEITGGSEFRSILLPKCTGIAVFDYANEGAKEAAAELGADEAAFLAPASCSDSTGQLEFVANGVTQGVDAIMISNNAGDQIQTAVDDAAEAGVAVVSWDSPIPSGQNEALFVAQVDFDETGRVMADMALNILGAGGGEFAILSASPDASNQNAWIESMESALATDDTYASLDLVDIVFGNDDADDSYSQALALVDSNPDLRLIMAPTTVGIAASAKAMQDEGLCDTVAVSGLGLPDEMRDFTLNGCAPEFALWSFVDLGYLAYYASYGIATGQLDPAAGAEFIAGRMGAYVIEADPTRDNGLRIVMGPFTVYNADNL